MNNKIKLKKNKTFKNEQGITLVALVITIVILIILATISINLVFKQGGILDQARYAKDLYEQKKQEEETELNTAYDKIEEAMPKPKSVEDMLESGELKIGDYVNYDCKTGATVASYPSEEAKNGYGLQTFTLADYNYGWRVMGVDENGQLLLLAEDFVPLTGGYTDTTSGRTFYYLKGQAGYVNGVKELNDICAIYGQGQYSTGARSINVEDVNKITGYNPEIAQYEKGKVSEYGNDVTYKLTGGKVYYQGSKQPLASTESSETKFTYYTGSEWKILAEGGSATLKSTYYYYYPDTLGIVKTSAEYKMLFTNSSTGKYSANAGTTSEFKYWLGSSFICTYHGMADMSARVVDIGRVSNAVMYGSDDYQYSDYYGVRPVVSIQSDIILKDSGTQKDGCTLWNLSEK